MGYSLVITSAAAAGDKEARRSHGPCEGGWRTFEESERLTLPPTNIAPVRGYLEDPFPFQGTLCQVPCLWEGGYFLVCPIFVVDLKMRPDFHFSRVCFRFHSFQQSFLSKTRTGKIPLEFLSPTNMAPDRASLQEETDLAGASPQVPCHSFQRFDIQMQHDAAQNTATSEA